MDRSAVNKDIWLGIKLEYKVYTCRNNYLYDATVLYSGKGRRKFGE